MTIEDPVEYTFDSINQIQINEQAGVTFASGLRSILRQDPDVILVGEIRDVDTARIAVQSALTGHFVLSSLHATDAVAALHRLLDMGIETFLVASSVTAVIAQRLVRRICTVLRRALRADSLRSCAFLATLGGRDPAGGFRARRGLQLLRADRLPGPDRRLRADGGHRRDPGTRPRPGRARRDAQGRPVARACAPCRRRRCGSSTRASPRWPRSCVRSIWWGADDAEVRLRRDRT